MRALPLAAAALLAAAGAARAQDDPCAGFKWPIGREQQAFATAIPPVANGAAYSPGVPVEVTLSPQAEVAYSIKPRRAPKAAPAYGAELTGVVTEPGSYQATLSEEAWIDLAQNGKVLRSTAFSGKAGCPGVRKSVRFDLSTGPLAILISDSAGQTVKLDLLPAK